MCTKWSSIRKMNAFKRKIANCLWENKTKVNNNLLILAITFANIEAPIFDKKKTQTLSAYTLKYLFGLLIPLRWRCHWVSRRQGILLSLNASHSNYYLILDLEENFRASWKQNTHLSTLSSVNISARSAKMTAKCEYINRILLLVLNTISLSVFFRKTIQLILFRCFSLNNL